MPNIHYSAADSAGRNVEETRQEPSQAGLGRVAGRVAFITGAARGQGRSHAVRLAQEGADIIALDLCEPIMTLPYSPASPAELAETVGIVESLGRRAVGIQADVRDLAALRVGLDDAVAKLGRLDIVCANAGIASYGRSHELTQQSWQDVIDVNLTGVWHTTTAATKHLIAAGRGATIIITSSVAGLRGLATLAHYSAAKHGTIGLMRTLAVELGMYGIRVNAVLPTTVATPMVDNEPFLRMALPDVRDPTWADFAERPGANPLDLNFVESIDISNAVLFLASDEARYINAVALPVDGGALAH